MNNENKYRIDNISKNLIENYKAVEITLEDFLIWMKTMKNTVLKIFQKFIK